MAQQRHTRRHRAFIAVLIKAREDARLMQGQLSRRLKRPRPFVHLVESGERMVSIIEFPDYAKALGIAATDLLGQVLDLEKALEEKAGEAIAVKIDGRSKRKKKR